MSTTRHKFYTPLLTPLIGLVTGIYLQSELSLPTSMLVVVIFATGCVVTYALMRTKKTLIRYSSAVLIGLVGALLLVVQRNEHENLLELIARKKITITGTVTEKDAWGRFGSDDVLRITTHSIITNDTTLNVTCDILCYVKHHTRCMVGDEVSVSNVVLKPAPQQSASGNPAYDDYLIKERLVGSLFLPSIRALKCINRPSWSVRRWLWNFRIRTYGALNSLFTPITKSYVGLIFLGNKQQKSIDHLRLMFNYWGLSHYLARSGIHIILIIMIWKFLLSLIPLHIAFKRIFLILLCIVYDLVSWASIPFTRAYYAFLITEGGGLCDYQTNSLHILTLMCLAILLYNPMQLFFLDFQLTFGLTFTLIIFSMLVARHQNHGKFAKIT
ncbi:MAG: ComEC/Rec2 family competence protein [Candidatus Babeliales bacterium]|jgi:competence protein ComEC